MPLEEDIAKAYERYFTHASRPSVDPTNSRQSARRVLRSADRLLTSLTLLHKAKSRSEVMYLDDVPPGRLFEVGCGSGELLARMQQRGWQVEGQEVDSGAAVLTQRAYGLTVHFGPLERLTIPEATFDAVVMSHVIEHVHDPLNVLRQCHRVLKPGGRLVVVTPNVESLAHRRFRSNWVHLDPPRHLHLFSLNSLHNVVGRAGFQRCESWTTAARARFAVAGSRAIRCQGTYDMLAPRKAGASVWAALAEICEQLLLSFDSRAGEECVLRATK